MAQAKRKPTLGRYRSHAYYRWRGRFRFDRWKTAGCLPESYLKWREFAALRPLKEGHRFLRYLVKTKPTRKTWQFRWFRPVDVDQFLAEFGPALHAYFTCRGRWQKLCGLRDYRLPKARSGEAPLAAPFGIEVEIDQKENLEIRTLPSRQPEPLLRLLEALARVLTILEDWGLILPGYQMSLHVNVRLTAQAQRRLTKKKIQKYDSPGEFYPEVERYLWLLGLATLSPSRLDYLSQRSRHQVRTLEIAVESRPGYRYHYLRDRRLHLSLLEISAYFDVQYFRWLLLELVWLATEGNLPEVKKRLNRLERLFTIHRLPRLVNHQTNRFNRRTCAKFVDRKWTTVQVQLFGLRRAIIEQFPLPPSL